MFGLPHLKKVFVFVCAVLRWCLCLSLSVHPSIPDSLFDWDHAVICFQCYSHSEMGHVPPTTICLYYRADIGVGLWSLCTLLSLSLFSLSLTPSLSPSLHPLVIWCPDGAVAGKGSFSCAPYFLQKNLLQGRKRKKYQWTPSAVICVQ